MTTNHEGNGSGHEAAGAAGPRPVAVSVITTEHFTLQGARSSTIAESTGRASMFLSAISGGLVALGLIATATHVGTAFFVFGLILLPTLTFVGLVTFDRVLQSGIEDLGYARRIAMLRGFYFDEAPEIAPYLLSVREPERLNVQGLRSGLWQGFLTVAGTVSVVTSVLAGSAVGLLAAVLSGHSLAAAVCAGVVAGLVVLAAMMRHQRLTWHRALAMPLIVSDEPGTTLVTSGSAASTDPRLHRPAGGGLLHQNSEPSSRTGAAVFTAYCRLRVGADLDGTSATSRSAGAAQSGN